MSIRYDEANRIFELDTRNTSYRIGIVDEEGFVGHIYYGQKIRPQKCDQFLRTCEAPFVPSKNNRERCSFMDTFPTEYSGNGIGDYRESCIAVKTANGSRTVDLKFVDYDIVNGKPGISGLPASFAGEEEVQTLVVHMMDGGCGIDVDLIYSVFEDEDVITRSVSVKNAGDKDVRLTKVYSACIDMDDEDFEMLTLHGSWARERQIERRPIAYGKQSVSSLRGESSHQDHPFMAWMTKGTDQTTGDVYGMHFVYSGNFIAQIEKSQFDSIRAVMGIHSEGFEWWLTPGETFTAPEVVLTYSHDGLGQMTRNLHDFYRCHMIRSRYLHQKRPVLINNWEATYFDFTREKLIAIAQKAKECGVELFVLDDGWFGARTTDHAGLGDWVANPDRLPEGITGIAEDIEKVGLKFGLWFEPEMTNKDSDLYREHPDWILSVPGRHDSHGRFQYVLDFSRKEVVDRIYEMMAKILSTAKVSYVKWDMNRSITECYSAALPADRQGEVFHRYILGVYDLYERLTSTFPHVLFESCASGGGRFDPGILYYAPQGWTSDDTDAIERVKIQYGTSMCYPISSMGSHVSVVPNHQTRRETPLKTRANAAYFGTFGYELDLNKLTAEEIEEVKEQVKFMKAYREVIQYGTFYRLASPFDDEECGWMVVSDDKKTAIVAWFRTLYTPNKCFTRMKLHGLDPDAIYSCNVLGGQALTVSKTPDGKLIYEKVSGDKGEDSAVNVIAGPSCYGDELMNLGLITSDTSAGEIVGEDMPCGDYDSRLYVLKAE